MKCLSSIAFAAAAVLLFVMGQTALAAKPDVVVRDHNGRPTIFIDGVPTAAPSYSSTITARKQSFDKSMPYFYKHGSMNVYFISPAVRRWYDTRFWVGDKIDPTGSLADNKPPYDYDLDQMAADIIKNDPDAWIIVRLFIFPSGEWQENHRQEYFISENGDMGEVPSLASDLYWETSARFCNALITYVESRPWADRVIGYANYWINEGAHEPVAHGWLYDHNPVMIGRWREFLRAKYGNVNALRAAWGDSTLSFDRVDVPRDPILGTVPEVTNILYWQDRRSNQQMRDYLLLQKELFHQRVKQVCGASADASGRNVLMLHDFFKQTMLGWNLWGFFDYGTAEGVSWSPAYPELMAGSGSMGVAPLIGTTKGLDGIITPHDYQARGIGGVYEPEGIVDTTILRGLYFYSEMDTRTYLGSQKKDIAVARNDKEFSAIMWRNVAGGITRGFNSYWMDLSGGHDWFAGDSIQEIIDRQAAVMDQSLEWRHDTVPGIAMILDDTAVLETNGTGNYMNEAIMWEQKMGIARCGVPHNIYMFEDLKLDNFPRHRVYYFPNLFRVDEERMAILREKVFRDGAVVVWGPGSGISDGETIDAAHASQLTGFSFETIKANTPRRIIVTDFDHPITAGLSAATILGGPLPYGPVILPTDGLVLGEAWVKGGFNYTGMALKEFGKGAASSPEGINSRGAGDYAALFMTAVNLPAPLWRNIARYAGANVYCETDDVLMADTSVVALHSVQSGKKRIALPGKYTVTDLVTGKRVARSTNAIEFTIDAPQTAVFLLER